MPNDLAGLADIFFHLLPARIGGVVPVISGFLTFPLMAGFSYLAVNLQLALLDKPFPRLLKRSFLGFWGLLFTGFLVAEFRLIVLKDFRLANILGPFFNAAIVAAGLGSSLYVFWRSRALSVPGERRFVGRMSGYFFFAYAVFVILFFLPLRFPISWLVPVRSLLGFAYLLPLLAWLKAHLREIGGVSLIGLAGVGPMLDRWLERRDLSPRERQIVRCVLDGKSNAMIEEDLFISRRTVESHLYSIYQKLGVKNRLQLARLAAAEIQSRAPTSQV